MTPCRLRAAKPVDAPAISQLVSRLTVHHIAGEFPERARNGLLASMTPNAVRSYLALSYRFTLAEVGDELAGVVAVKLPAHLFYLFVAESHQQRGIARKLWDHARRTTPAIVWTVNAAVAARPVYERLGFTARGPAGGHAWWSDLIADDVAGSNSVLSLLDADAAAPRR